MVNAITRIQSHATQIITGAIRTTAGATVDVEAHLLPASQHLDQTAIEATMRIRTTPLFAEMTPSENINTAQSPLDWSLSILESKYRTQLDRLEKRQGHIVPPWWTTLFTRIAESPEGAVKEHDATPSATRSLQMNVHKSPHGRLPETPMELSFMHC